MKVSAKKTVPKKVAFVLHVLGEIVDENGFAEANTAELIDRTGLPRVTLLRVLDRARAFGLTWKIVGTHAARKRRFDLRGTEAASQSPKVPRSEKVKVSTGPICKITSRILHQSKNVGIECSGEVGLSLCREIERAWESRDFSTVRQEIESDGGAFDEALNLLFDDARSIEMRKWVAEQLGRLGLIAQPDIQETFGTFWIDAAAGLFQFETEKRSG